VANPGFIKTFDALAAVAAYTIAKFTTTDFAVQAAAASSDPLAGVSSEIAAASGERVDVILGGVAYVTSGGTIAAGDPITSDASGHAIKAAPAAGVNANCIGHARQSAVSGDVFEMIVERFTLQG
jgi:hypothetical protein